MNRKPENYRTILRANSDAKTIKGFARGYLTGIMYLAPSNSSGFINVCPMAGNCKLPCLFTAGRGAMARVANRRIEKTRFYAYHREDFINSLRFDIGALVRRAKKLGKHPAVRINGTSDLPQLALQMASEFPRVQFYDYTKIPRPWERTRKNYHLTFSHDGPDNLASCLDALAHGVNVSVVFDTRKGFRLPSVWHGFPVIDGDKTDLRFRDRAGVIVGLRAKGKAKTIRNGFVIEVAKLPGDGMNRKLTPDETREYIAHRFPAYNNASA